MVPPDWIKKVMDQDILWTHPESNMDLSTLPSNFFQTFSPKQQVTEMLWRHGLANLHNTDNEILVPHVVPETYGFDVVGDLATFLGRHLQTRICMIYDASIDSIRIRPRGNPQLLPLDLHTHKMLSDLLNDATEDGLPLEPAHIPRPPNSFILYRQHHHHAVTNANPGTPNTQISRIIADMWRNETPTVRNAFKELAEEKKRLHAKTYPDYQYSPRRPSEKVRRNHRIHMNNMPWLGQHPLGQQLVNNAVNNNGFIPIDNDFIAAMDAIGVLSGPNGLAPMRTFDAVNYAKDVQKLPTDQVGMEVAQWEPLQGNEFDDTFPMDELLNLEGA